MQSSTEEANPYLAMRAAKIARNEAHLTALGLMKQSKSDLPRSTTLASTKKIKKEQLNQESIRRSARNQEPIRRSARSSVKLLSFSYADPGEPSTARKRSRSIAVSVSTNVVSHSSQHSLQYTDVDDTENIVQRYPANSARNILINVNVLVVGNANDTIGGFLGSAMMQTGKACVMEEAARRSGFDRLGKISFNKYCGVQEWRNSAFFLWVNLEAPDSDVVNTFLGDGRQITWFGGSRMHDETKLIKKLIHVGRTASTGELDESDGLVLWCRQYNKETKSHGPYLCLGRLGYKTHFPGSRPLKFVWTLLDFDLLTKQRAFREMVSANQNKEARERVTSPLSY